MKIEMLSSRVVGLSDEMHWSQTYAEGNILATLELTSDGSFSAKSEGDKFLTNLVILLKRRQPQDKTAFRLLVNQYISSSLIQNRINSLIVGIYLDVHIYLFCKTQGTALLKRGSLWSEVIKGDGFVHGEVLEKDMVVLSTESFNKLLSEREVIKEFDQEEDPLLASEKLGSLLHNFDNSKGAAAIFTFFKKADSVLLDETGQEKTLDKLITDVVLQTEELPAKTAVDLPPAPVLTVEKIIPQPEPEKTVIKSSINMANKLGLIKDKLLSWFPQKLKEEETEATFPYQEQVRGGIFASPRKRILAIALVLLVVLAGSIILNFNQPKNNSKISDIEPYLETLTRQIEEGEGLRELNNLRAKTLLMDSVKSLSEIREKYKKGTKERITIEELLQRAQNALSAVTKIYRIDSPGIFLDLTVIKPNASAQNFALYQDQLAVLDTRNVSVFNINVSSLASSIAGGGEKTPGPTLIANHGNNIFVLTQNGIVKIDTKSKNQQAVVNSLKEIGSAQDLVGFAGNIYLLDGTNKKIWKFMALESGYSSAKTYLGEDETIDLTEVKSLAIDGSVFVLGGGTVKKYTRGSVEPFSLEGLDKPFVEAATIFTDDESKFIYILDKGNGRVVVFDKKGGYDSSYEWSGISGVSDMVVSEKQKKILLLSGSNIYTIDLKQ